MTWIKSILKYFKLEENEKINQHWLLFTIGVIIFFNLMIIEVGGNYLYDLVKGILPFLK